MAATCLVLLTAGLVSVRAFRGPLPAAEAAQAAELAQGSRKPNIVVVMADDMRFDDLQFAPTLRRLARRGVTFHNSFSPFPLCCPARASFLTGQLTHNHRIYWHERPYGYGAFDDSRTLATSMRRAGYRTGFVGKYLNRYGLDRSKVTGGPSYRYVPRGWTDWFATFQGSARQPGVRGDAYNYMSTPFNVNGRVRNHVDRYQTNVVGSYSRRLIERYHRRRDPFFLYVNYLAPHFGGPRERDDPLRVRDRRGRRVEVRTPARPVSVRNRFDGLIDRARGLRRGGSAEADVSDKPGFIRRLPEPSRSERRAGRALTRQRAQAIYVMDEEIRRTIRTLKRTGEWSNTYVVFTSDNGYYLGEHRIVQGKVRGHEPSLRVPMIIAGPGARNGTGRYDPITTVDLTRTILDLGGAAAPKAPDGTSLLPTLRGGDQGWNRAVPVESARGTRAPRRTVFRPGDVLRSSGVRTARYSYIRYSDGQTELYDLQADPHQESSAHQDPELAQARELLRQAWDQMYRCRGTQCLAPLPEALRVAPAENRAGTRAWLAAHERRYGYR